MIRAGRGEAQSPEPGFTLIEVLLALGIMAFITATLLGVVNNTAKIKRLTEASQDRTHAARVALMRLTREIEMAFLSDSENPGLPDKRTMFIGGSHTDTDELKFSWFGRQRLRFDPGEADTSILHYYVEPDPSDRSILNLMRRETRRLEARDTATMPGEAFILCAGISRVKFSYYDVKKKEWREEWNTLGVSGVQYLPAHVRISLTIIDERGRPVTYTSAARIQMNERVGYRPGRA